MCTHPSDSRFSDSRSSDGSRSLTYQRSFRRSLKYSTCPPDSWCGPMLLGLIGKSRIAIFQCTKPFLPGSPISRFPICRRVFRFNPSRSSQVHVTYIHMTTIICFCRVFGVRSFKVYDSLVTGVPDFPMNLKHRWTYSLSGLSPMADLCHVSLR